MKGFINNCGYVMIQNDKGKLPRQIQLHRYVMQKTYGIEIPEEFVVHHKDGNKLNNSVDNLVVLTKAGHLRWHHNGENSTLSKLTEKDVFAIYDYVKNGGTVKDAAKQYNISEGVIYDILSRSSWKHLNLPVLKWERRYTSPQYKTVNAGEANSHAKLTEAQVLEIRKALATGEICRTIGERYGVSREVISNIKHNRLWAHIQLTDLSQISKRNGGGARGSKNGYAKLTEEKVKEIKYLLRTTNLNTVELGERFGVSNMLIGRIKNGKAWIHVKED